MITPKIILYKHKTYQDGSHPIILQVVEKGKPIRKVIAKCKPSEWLPSKNRVSSKNLRFSQINHQIETALRNYGSKPELSLELFFKSYLEQIKAKQQVSLYETNLHLLNELLEFEPSVDFNTLDKSFIVRFSSDLMARNRANTVRVKMQTFGKLIKLAIAAGHMKSNPMEGLIFKKEKTIKPKLQVDELKLLSDYPCDGKIGAVRDVFFASIYLRGTRVGDILFLTQDNINNGRLTFIEQKTGRIRNMEITPELELIFNRWSGQSPFGYIFPILDCPLKNLEDKFKRRKSMNKATTLVNYYLKKLSKLLSLDKSISPHTARHSFSRLANNTIKDTTVTKDLVGHSSLAIHEGYISEISDDIEMDAYARKVFDKLK